MAFRIFYITPFILIIFLIACHAPVDSKIIRFDIYADSLNKVREKQSFVLLQNHIVDPEEFKGLQYFMPHPDYVVNAKVEFITPKEVVFKTNTQRSPTYYQVALLNFKINDTICQLTLYASSPDGNKDLFLPFKDLSNGKSTYSAGRYIEFASNEIIQNNQMKIDFNQAFNPYCHYNINYSCPIVPKENYLNVHIHAGEKQQHD
jgi:uncharacterized protein (DUF1684 family)